MSKKKKVDDRKQLLIRYKIDEKGCVSMIKWLIAKGYFSKEFLL